MAGAGFKNFVTNNVLTASEVNTYLMQQSVMTFPTAAARGSAIASPSEGMVSYITGTDRVELYTGAAWKSYTAGNIPIAPSSVTGVGTGAVVAQTALNKISFNTCQRIEVNGVFSSAYQNYRILLRVNPTATNQTFLFQFRDASGNVARSVYTWMGAYQVIGAGVLAWTGSGATSYDMGRINNFSYATAALDVFHPFTGDRTSVQSQTYSETTNLMWSNSSLQMLEFVSYTGFSLVVSSGTIQGSIQVFGINE